MRLSNFIFLTVFFIFSVSVDGNVLKSPEPDYVITKEQILRSGYTGLGEILNELVIANGESTNRFTNHNGDGSVTVDFNNIGKESLLVLLNGSRLTKKNYGAFDFTNIPISIIERVEIHLLNNKGQFTTGGATGVINIITENSLDGVRIDTYYGLSERGDAESQNYSVSYGKESEKGRVNIISEFSNSKPIFARDRKISALPVYGTGVNLGSIITPQGSFQFVDPITGEYYSSVTTLLGTNGFNEPNDPDLIPFTRELRYNYAPENYLLTPQEKYSLYLNGNYELSNDLSFSAELLFNRRKSEQMLAPDPMSIYNYYSPVIVIGSSNPYNPYYGQDFRLYSINRRIVELGNRFKNQESDKFFYKAGLQGQSELGKGWKWKANITFNKNNETENLSGLVDTERVLTALGNNCTGDCVPLNLFGGSGTITQEMLDYIAYEGLSETDTKVTSFQFHASSTLAELSSGSLDLEMGYEYRKHSGYYRPDAALINGNISSRLNPYYLFDGSYHVSEIYADFDVPLSKKLDLYTSAKLSKYDFTNVELSGGVHFRYKPLNSLTFDLGYARVNNEPKLYELFMQESFIGLISYYLPVNEDYYLSTRGNDDLSLEKFDNFSLNINYRPQWSEGLEMDFLLLKQSSDNLVTLESLNYLRSSCRYSGEPLYCDRFTPIDQYTYEAVTTFVNGIRSFDVFNIGYNLKYKVSTDSAEYIFALNNLYIKNNEIKRDLGANREHVINSITLADSLGDYDVEREIPRLKTNFTIDMKIKDFSINYQARYISGFEEECDSNYLAIVPTNNPNAPGGVVPEDFQWCTYASSINSSNNRRHVGGTTFHDLNFEYDWKQYDSKIMLGIENVFDKTPPLSSTADANSYLTHIYNGTGRYYWLRFSKDF